MPEHDVSEASLPPNVGELVESLRAFGYDLPAALGDLVDNSVTAGATRVDVEFSSDPGCAWVAVVDNGRGMNETELHEAMRFASRGPHGPRHAEDLGRFGLGLKTASLSYARALTVLSGRDTSIAARTWDLDVITGRRDWRVLTSVDEETSRISAELGFDGPGTLVLWRKLDAGLERDALARKIGEAGEQLGVLFHRYIAAGRIRLHVAGRRIAAWDPFLLHHPATQDLGTEILDYGSVQAKVHPVVLPHPTRLEPKTFRTLAGPGGMVAHQGFYVYRGDRLLRAGGWLGLPKLPMTPLTRLARLAVQFEARDDLAWAVDVRKSTIRPPSVLEKRLTHLAEHTRRCSERVFTHRGTLEHAGAGGDRPAAVWRQYRLGGRTSYRVNRSHPVVATALTGATGTSVEAILRLVEATLPIGFIAQEMIADGVGTDRALVPGVDEDDIRSSLREMLAAFPADTTQRGELVRALAATEPFSRFPDLVAEIVDSDSPEGV